MDFQEMMQKSRDHLLAENKRLKDSCDEEVREISQEVRELEADNQSLRRQRDALGFFQMKKKKDIDAVLEKYSVHISELNRKKDELISNTDSRIQKTTGIWQLLTEKKVES